MKLNRKKIIIILAVLLGIQALIFLYFNLLSPESISKRKYNKSLVDGFKKDAIVSLTISDLKDSFLIEKKDGSWQIKTKDKYIPADIVQIANYFEILVKLTNGVIVDSGEKSENLKKYGFHEETSLKVDVKTNSKKDFSLVIGAVGPGKKTSYLKLNNEKKIREVHSNVSSQTGNMPISWAKRTIFNPDIMLDDVQKLEVNSYNLKWYKGSYSIDLIKDPGNKDDRGRREITPGVKGKLKDYALEGIIESFLTVYVYDYKIDSDVKGREKLAYVKMTLYDKSAYGLTVYKADKSDAGDYIITADFTDYQYIVNENYINKFIKSPADLVH